MSNFTSVAESLLGSDFAADSPLFGMGDESLVPLLAQEIETYTEHPVAAKEKIVPFPLWRKEDPITRIGVPLHATVTAWNGTGPRGDAFVAGRVHLYTPGLAYFHLPPLWMDTGFTPWTVAIQEAVRVVLLSEKTMFCRGCQCEFSSTEAPSAAAIILMENCIQCLAIEDAIRRDTPGI